MFSKVDSKTSAEAPNVGTKSTMPSIVSTDLKINGNLVSQGDVQVEGEIEGDVRSRNLTIGETGSVDGEIHADVVLVSGTVKGRINAKTVTLAKSARVIGDIAHESLAMESGAHLEGQVSRLDDVKAAAATASVALGGAKPEPAKSAAVAGAKPDVGNSPSGSAGAR
jgi:cytoskeletal protein CcmA (bactofilin family)